MKIKALRSIAGSYGVLPEGGETVVKDSIGKELVEAGLVVEVGDDQPEPEPEPEPKQEFKSSVRLKGRK